MINRQLDGTGQMLDARKMINRQLDGTGQMLDARK
jgi:hypothetical protein